MFIKKITLLVFFLTTIYQLSAQTNMLKVVDYKSGETIPFAHVCFEQINGDEKYYFITDKNGNVSIPTEDEYIIAVSFVGYKPQIDTLRGKGDQVIKLYPKVFDLDQIVVTADLKAQKVDQSIYNVKVIDAREIEFKAATNLSDIMANAVNVKLQHDPALGTSLRLKGLSGNNVKILVDGVPVIGRVGGNIDLSQLNLYNIDHIEMVEGPLSVIYGSNALAGAINIITKENQYSRLKAKVNSYYETVGTYNFDAGVSLKKGKHGFAISGGRNFFDGFSAPNNENKVPQIEERYTDWKPKEQYNADLYYTLNGNKSKLKFQSSFMKERILSRGSLQAPQYYTAFDDWFYTTRFSNRLEYKKEFKSGLSYNVLGSHSYFLRRNLTYFKDLDLLTSEHIDEDSTQFNAFLLRALFGNSSDNKLNFVTGVDVNYEIATGERILNDNKQIGDYALFASLRYKINDKIIIQPGLRVAYNSEFSVPPVPSVNLKWNMMPRITLRASYARGYRAPTLKELYIYFVDINHNIQPNEDLKAEYGHNVDLALAFNTERESKTHYSHVELDLFYNKMNNIIYLARREVADLKDPIYKYINIVNYNTVGGKLTFQYNYYPYLDFGFGFGETGTYSSFSNNSNSLNDYKFSPDLNLNISNHIQKWKFTLTLSYKYTGESYLYDVDENDQINITTLENYHNMDLTLVKKLFTNRLTISAGVKNIFNNTNIDVAGSGAGTAHTSSNSSPVAYGRVYFTRLTYNLFK